MITRCGFARHGLLTSHLEVFSADELAAGLAVDLSRFLSVQSRFLRVRGRISKRGCRTAPLPAVDNDLQTVGRFSWLRPEGHDHQYPWTDFRPTGNIIPGASA